MHVIGLAHSTEMAKKYVGYERKAFGSTRLTDRHCIDLNLLVVFDALMAERNVTRGRGTTV